MTLRIACRRHDWTNALFNGRIAEPSMEFLPEAHLGLEALTGAPPSVDFMECGLFNYYQARCQGAPIRALPVFLRAAFRHSFIFVNSNSGIDRPKDLEGKRVATRFGMTATVWARALLQHQYGVALEKIRWLNKETRAVTPYALPAGMVVDSADKGVNLEDLLVAGEVDALIHASVIATKLLPRGNVKRLFPNAQDEERAYYRSTGIFPVMNVIAFRERDLQERPAAIEAVFDAFCRAKGIGLDVMQNVRGSGLAWYYDALESQIAFLGADPVPYSLAKTGPTLEAFVEHGLEQGLFLKRLTLDDLFWKEKPPAEVRILPHGL
jgi:4,5-dihydroxyphthalate decarboxylase